MGAGGNKIGKLLKWMALDSTDSFHVLFLSLSSISAPNTVWSSITALVKIDTIYWRGSSQLKLVGRSGGNANVSAWFEKSGTLGGEGVSTTKLAHPFSDRVCRQWIPQPHMVSGVLQGFIVVVTSNLPCRLLEERVLVPALKCLKWNSSSLVKPFQ